MGHSSNLASRMKPVSILLLSLTVVATEWTCEDCKVAAPSLGRYTTSPDAIQSQSDDLVIEFCPEVENVEQCVEELPHLWGALAKIILPEHYKHMCDDMECDDHIQSPAGLQPRLPDCGDCVARVIAVTDYLAHDDLIQTWVSVILDLGGRLVHHLRVLHPLAQPARVLGAAPHAGDGCSA